MTYEKFLEEFLSKGLLKRQKSDLRTVEKLVRRAHKDLKTSKANLDIDFSVASLSEKVPILNYFETASQVHIFEI